MIRFKHKSIEMPLEIEKGDVIDLSIENPGFLRSFVNDLLTADSDDFSLSEDGKELEFEKTCLLITDLYHLDPNNKKVLAAIYKKIDRESLTPERKEQFDEINRRIADLLTDIAADFEGSISYNEALSLPQVLGMLDFKFDFDDATFLTSFLSYVKAWREATNLKLVFAIDAFSLLKSQEITTLADELGYLGLSLVNVSSHSYDKQSTIKQKITIDNDLCEF